MHPNLHRHHPIALIQTTCATYESARQGLQPFDIVEVIRYLARGDKPVGHGHVIADLNGPRFQCFAEEGDATVAGTPMYNPFGRYRLMNMRDIARDN
jgi:hypothetical protein